MKYALETDLEAVTSSIDANNLKMNIGKTQLMILCRNRKNVCDTLTIGHKGVNVACKECIWYLRS